MHPLNVLRDTLAATPRNLAGSGDRLSLSPPASPSSSTAATAPTSPLLAPDHDYVANGRSALLARDYAAAQAAFGVLRKSSNARERHDGNVGLAMLTLACLPPAVATQVYPTTYLHAVPPIGLQAADAARTLTDDVPLRAADAGPKAGTSAAASDETASAPLQDAAVAFRRALQVLRGDAPEPTSEMVRLGRLAAALQAGSLDDIFRCLTLAPPGVEATLAAAAHAVASGRLEAARTTLARAMGAPGIMGNQLGVQVLTLGRSYDASPEQQALWLMAATLAKMGPRGSFSRGEAALERLLCAPGDGYAVAMAQLVAAEAGDKPAAWQALATRYPQSAELALVGVRLGAVAPAGVAALHAARSDDAQLWQASYAHASANEAWADACTSLLRLQALRPTADQAGMLAWLHQQLERDGDAVAHWQDVALAAKPSQTQALLVRAERRIAAHQVDAADLQQLRQLLGAGHAEAAVPLVRGLQQQGRDDEALAVLDSFLEGPNAELSGYNYALLLRARHHLYERGDKVRNHDEACAAVRQAQADLARIGPESAVYRAALQLQPFLAERAEQVAAGIRYRLDERQVRQELAQGGLIHVRANLEHHRRNLANSESELFWLLTALLYKAMGPGNYAKATHAAENAVDLALMRDRLHPEAEALLRELDQHNEGAMRRIVALLNGSLGWLTGLGLGK